MTNQKKQSYWVFVQPLLFVLLLWVVYGVDQLFDLRLYRYALEPRTASGLLGIFTFPLLHGSIEHIAGNSISVLTLLTGVRYFFPQLFTRVFLWSYVLPGVLTWIIARPSYHLGASGMIYALSAFLFVSGIIRSNRYLLALSLLVVFLYGSSFWYMFPIEDGISWEGHLSGAITGLLLGILYRKEKPTVYVKEKTYFEDESDDDEDPLIGDLWKNEANPTHPTRIVYHIKQDQSAQD